MDTVLGTTFDLELFFKKYYTCYFFFLNTSKKEIDNNIFRIVAVALLQIVIHNIYLSIAYKLGKKKNITRIFLRITCYEGNTRIIFKESKGLV